MNRSFTIRDRNGRTWGSFDVISEKYGKVFGYLRPTKQFAEVAPVFARHASLLVERRHEGADDTMARIKELGAYVMDNKSGEIFDLRGEIFVDQNLLVACALYPPSNSSPR